MRDVGVADLNGNRNPQTTYDTNPIAAELLAEKAEQTGVERFVLSPRAACAARPTTPTRSAEAPFALQTAYGHSKLVAEHDMAPLDDDTCRRGAHPMAKVVLQAMQSWRPVLHIEDLSQTALAVLEGPRELVHNNAFNVGSTTEDDISARSRRSSPTSRGSHFVGRRRRRGGHALAPRRLLEARARSPHAGPQWTVKRGVEELARAYAEWGNPPSQPTALIAP